MVKILFLSDSLSLKCLLEFFTLFFLIAFFVLQGTLAAQNVGANVIDSGYRRNVRRTEFHPQTWSSHLPPTDTRTPGWIRHSSRKFSHTRYLISDIRVDTFSCLSNVFRYAQSLTENILCSYRNAQYSTKLCYYVVRGL